MGEAVTRKVDQIHRHHARMKERKYGWAVRPATLLIGWLVVIVGLITIPFPGPGWFTVFVGIGILSLELEWPNRLLRWGIRQYDRFEAWWKRQSRGVRILGIVLLVMLIWVVFACIFWVMWQWGMLDWAKPTLQPWVDKLPWA
ncbi:TIGR02611 family protein [Corynebacterium sp. ED61]|uniref:TIGR02611 family protein n=1 Tax=Corynebacterium sp. ED61 TaxID=2211360 RepID=UPI001D1675A7|nr:TIGR02611 family protein [Corynebacterium sp. ED61]